MFTYIKISETSILHRLFRFRATLKVHYFPCYRVLSSYWHTAKGFGKFEIVASVSRGLRDVRMRIRKVSSALDWRSRHGIKSPSALASNATTLFSRIGDSPMRATRRASSSAVVRELRFLARN